MTKAAAPFVPRSSPRTDRPARSGQAAGRSRGGVRAPGRQAHLRLGAISWLYDISCFLVVSSGSTDHRNSTHEVTREAAPSARARDSALGSKSGTRIRAHESKSLRTNGNELAGERDSTPGKTPCPISKLRIQKKILSPSIPQNPHSCHWICHWKIPCPSSPARSRRTSGQHRFTVSLGLLAVREIGGLQPSPSKSRGNAFMPLLSDASTQAWKAATCSAG